MFGGQAGGGKSDALLMAALQFAEFPGYSALLLRRTFAQMMLPDGILARAHEWLGGTEAKWRDSEKTYTFPAGAKLVFGHLETENDVYRYQGPAFSFVGYDELTQFSERQYAYLFSRLRRPAGSRIPPRMRSATNPGGVGHEWVFNRFIAPDHDPSRIFIPSSLDDNPSLDRDSYLRSMENLDPVTKAQLLRGDWNVRPDGNMFRRHWFPIVDAVPAGGKGVRYWDFAATEDANGNDPDYTVGVKMWRVGNAYYIEDVRRERLDPGGVEELLRATAAEDGKQFPQRFEEEGGSSGKIVKRHLIVNVLHGHDARGIRATGDKTERARPLSAQASVGNIFLVRGAWNGPLLDELVAFPQKGIHDDQVDAASGAMSLLAQNRSWISV